MNKPIQIATKAKARLLQPLNAASLSNSGGAASTINVDPGAYMKVPDTNNGAKARLLNSGSESQKLAAKALLAEAGITKN